MNKFEESSDLIVTAEQGTAVAKLLGEHKIVLLRNHGIVVAGPSIEETCIRGVLLEHSAKTQVAAASMGAFPGPPTPMLCSNENGFTGPMR